MTTPTHILIGAVIAKIVVKTGAIPGTEPSLTYLISILGANLPDFDVFAFVIPVVRNYLKGMGLSWNKNHRTDSFFHYPVFWLFVFYIASLLIKRMGNPTVLAYYQLTVINVVLHLVLDTFGVGAGICWLRPFSKRDYSFLRLQEPQMNVRDTVIQYRTHVLLKYEVVICLVSTFFLLR